MAKPTEWVQGFTGPIATRTPDGHARFCAYCNRMRSINGAATVIRATGQFLTTDQCAYIEQILMVEHVEDLCPMCLVEGMAVAP